MVENDIFKVTTNATLININDVNSISSNINGYITNSVAKTDD